MTQIRLLGFLLLFFVSACKPLLNLYSESNQIDKVKKNEYSKLNGRYQDTQEKMFGNIKHNRLKENNKNNRRLLDRLFVFNPQVSEEKPTTVEIIFKTKNKAVINAYQNDSIVFSKKIHGKFKDGYFYLRPKYFIIPIIPIFYWHNFERVRIGKCGNDLIVDHNLKSFVWTFMAGSSDKGQTTSIYKTIGK
jgi:hypothetical protein